MAKKAKKISTYLRGIVDEKTVAQVEAKIKEVLLAGEYVTITGVATLKVVEFKRKEAYIPGTTRKVKMPNYRLKIEAVKSFKKTLKDKAL